MKRQYDWSDVQRLGLLDPTAGPSERVANDVLPRLDKLQGKRIGLLDNSKTNAAALLADIGKALVHRHGASELVLRTKLIYSRIAPAELIDDLAKRCDAVLTAIGD